MLESEIYQRAKDAYRSRDTLHYDIPSDVKDRFELVRQALGRNTLPSTPGSHLLIKTASSSRFFTLTHEVRVGADPQNEIVLVSKFVSRIHCRFHCVAGDNWRIVDLQSRNGTYVNSVLCTELLLKNGDVIMIGDITLVFFDITPSQGPYAIGEKRATIHSHKKAQESQK